MLSKFYVRKVGLETNCQTYNCDEPVTLTRTSRKQACGCNRTWWRYPKVRVRPEDYDLFWEMFHSKLSKEECISSVVYLGTL